MKSKSIHFRLEESLNKRIEECAKYEKKKFSTFLTEWVSMLPTVTDWGVFECLTYLAEKHNISRADAMRRAVEKEAKIQGFKDFD